MANCYACKKLIVFDNARIGKNGRPIPLDPETQAPHDCPMREKTFTSPASSGNVIRVEEDKDDHGNESYTPPADLKPVGREIKPSEYVDHTTAAKGQLKLKTITDPTPEGMDLKYNKLAAEHNVKFSQYHPLGSIYTIAVYYEERQ